MVVRQDPWGDSPCSACSACSGTPCCRNLPLDARFLENQGDFINLLLLSCYDGLYPAMKDSGEWAVYLGRSCSHLGAEGKCLIHKSTGQSLICKSYDAHKCWYTDAFSTERFSTLIPFDTDMMIWLERRYDLIRNRFSFRLDWQDLCDASFEYRRNTLEINPLFVEPWTSTRLSFKKSKSEHFLFLPPYKRPENINHYELLTFRLGFPGVYLGVSDTCWAFTIKTSLNQSRLDMVRREYYPAIGHADGCYSFNSLMKEHPPFSETGEQWIILKQADLGILKALTVFDSTGRVKRWPSSREILDAVSSKSPDRAA